MKKSFSAALALFAVLMMVAVIPLGSVAATPNLSQPPASLPAITYYTNTSHYTITTNQWDSFIYNVIDNNSFVKYNCSKNATQQLILFDLSYSGLNPYGMELVVALSKIGFPDVHNMTKAFFATANQTSQIPGFTNIQALNAGAYPGFSWSQPKVHTPIQNYYEAGIVVAIIAATFVLYFVFNRKK